MFNTKKNIRIILIVVAFAVLFLICNSNKVEASELIWPIGGDNFSETYKEYDFYGAGNSAPYKEGKSGREYIVNNNLWVNEKYYYAKNESHYGVDITGKANEEYKIVSVVDGTVIATSGDRVNNPSVNYVDRNQRRTKAGLNDGGGYGNYVIIQESGEQGRCFLYAHLKGGSIKVSKGDKVTAGQEIAIMGSSGDSGHMHLHFEIRKSKASTLVTYRSGRHYLVLKNANTNLDPEEYIGSTPEMPSTEQDAIFGDIDGDGKITSLDACICLKLSTVDDIIDEIEVKGKFKKVDDLKILADVDDDGIVTATDAMVILKYSANISVGNFKMEEKSIKEFYEELV